METLQFDSGARTYRINGKGTLTFHPADPNLYTRIHQMGERLPDIETLLSGQQDMDGLTLMTMADKELKKALGEVFPGNDFEKLFDGVNLLAMTGTGKTVLENFIDALTPILCQGAEMCANQFAQAAADEAEHRRESQC